MTKASNSDKGARDSILAAAHTRRTFLKGMGFAAGATMILSPDANAQDSPPAENPNVAYFGREARELTLTVNGSAQKIKAEPRTTLLDALREQLNLTGPKEVCDRGSCGCCTVLLDGKSITSCMMLAVDAEGHDIVTIEGVAKDPKYKAMLESFFENDGAQCGYCIPGFVVRSAEMLSQNPSPSTEEIRQGLSGNICRCGTYTKIFESISGVSKGGAK